ncbi:hypothetical protein [Pontibacter sp. G13]|uniref:hypothetical protein n=1 Tax=Pontibacter sp. G13 TaxID=3074898 RepID=UPI00288931B6|nr:hypothetical protein [Pontibacter sp. G13]WNJ19533.1 hypothetical protein RJD25_03490 [Pontibacter sp. G13]
MNGKKQDGKLTADLSYLYEVAAGNDAFIRDILQMFLSNTPNGLQALEASITQQNPDRVKFFAQKLRRPFLALGREDVGDQLERLERLAATGVQSDMIRDLYDSIQQEATDCLQDVQLELNRIVK